MQNIPQFETGDLNTIMAWYLTGKVTMRDLCDALNERLREKVERAQGPHAGPVRQPNCF